ncbi:hypothetical protein FIV41_03225 [Pseudomonas marginalis]|uniref:DUF4148 domain-containing protein n=1 Tax=Pseudomonas marginalis TaxID=298 RepID=A0A9X9BYQ7_PSEMA|nr:hypothetical protein [Pseudomonas marginalis]TWR63134.1 hypothetical protein FIV41_03225 [Pseudomonas marginalis]SEB32824.1 hypothetical protein SAMN04490193_0179 [Pseudomonas marginalis]
MSHTIRIAGALVLSSFIFAPLAMAEESPAFVARAIAHEKQVEQQQLAYENAKQDSLKALQASAVPGQSVKGSHT